MLLCGSRPTGGVSRNAEALMFSIYDEHTHICKVLQRIGCCARVHHFPLVHQSQVVKQPEDGVARLVDGEDYSFTCPGQPGHA